MTDTAAQLQTALAALHDIARADWRGPKPAAITVAEVALRHIGACDCHREAPNGT